MNRFSPQTPWLLVSVAVFFSLVMTAIAYVTGVSYRLQPWALPFGENAVIYCFFFLPLWLFAATTGAPFTRGAAWFALGVSTVTGWTLYRVLSSPDAHFFTATVVTVASIPVALLYLSARQTPDLLSRLAMAKVLTVLFLVLNTFVFLKITSYFTPAIDFKIVFLENLLHLTGYLGNPLEANAEGYLSGAIKTVYLFIPVFIMFFIMYLKQAHPASPFFSSYILSVVVGISLYGFAPAVGPTAVFFVLPDTQLQSLGWDMFYFPTGDMPCNAMPSLHTTWSLLMIFCCLHLRGVLRFFFILIALTSAAGTMTTYNHWLIDLGMAFPLSVACLCIVSYFQTHSRRVAGLLLLCSLLLLFWFSLLASPDVPPFGAAILWPVLITTVMLPLAGLWTVRREVLAPADYVPNR